jgi:hypothetical protein
MLSRCERLLNGWASGWEQLFGHFTSVPKVRNRLFGTLARGAEEKPMPFHRAGPNSQHADRHHKRHKSWMATIAMW